MDTIYKFIFISLFLGMLIYKYLKYGYSCLLSVRFWFLVYFFCYVLFPCIFIERINIEREWFWSYQTMEITRIVVFSSAALLLSMFAFFSVKRLEYDFVVEQRYRLFYYIANIMICIISFLYIYGIFKLISIIRSNGYINGYIELQKQGPEIMRQLGLKKSIYILLSLIFYSYFYKRRKIIFMPLILVVLFGTLWGSRTDSLICLLFLYLFFVAMYKKSFFLYIIPLFIILLVGVLFARSEAVSKNQNFIIIVFGEFIETFSTLPYIISERLTGEGMSLESLYQVYISGLLPGFVKTIIGGNSIGRELALKIGRGYGLACNFLTELLYLFGIIGLIAIPFLYIVFHICDKYLNSYNTFLFKLIIILQIRLFVREGFPQMATSLYIIIIYMIIPYFFSQKNRFLKIALQ